MIVGTIVADRASEMEFIQRNDVIQQFATYIAHPAFGGSVLPPTPYGAHRLEITRLSRTAKSHCRTWHRDQTPHIDKLMADRLEVGSSVKPLTGGLEPISIYFSVLSPVFTSLIFIQEAQRSTSCFRDSRPDCCSKVLPKGTCRVRSSSAAGHHCGRKPVISDRHRPTETATCSRSKVLLPT